MRYDILRVRELNSRLMPDASSLVVPIVPTVSMMEAAADARNVFMPGDRLADWLLPEAEVSDGGDLTDPDLAARLGARRAYELQIMAEIWAGCVSGLREWSRKRGIEGSNMMVDGWFRPELDDCPESGWPANMDGVTDVHRCHVAQRFGIPPFTHAELSIPHCDLALVVPAPMRCASIMAMRGGQREFLMDYHLLGLDDVIDMDRLPFIPGYTIEHSFDNEERHRILVAAAWKAAAGTVLTMGDDDEQMPLPPRSASVYLTRLGGHARGVREEIAAYHWRLPHEGLVFTSRHATLRLKARGATLEVSFENEGRSFTLNGMDFRLPHVSELLLSTVREMAVQGDSNVRTTIPT